MSVKIILTFVSHSVIMQNKLLSITRNIIPYIRELRPLAGSVTAAILWQQLDYWFAKHPDGFYKFLEPCDHAAYHPDRGESWIEELGFSKDEFRTAFDKIGVRHSTKTQYLKAADHSFEKNGKVYFFCSYHDNKTGLTWYFRNHFVVDNAINSLLYAANRESQFAGNRESQSLQIGNPDLYGSGIPICTNRESRFALNTETTTEITTETTTPPSGDGSSVFENLKTLILPPCLKSPEKANSAIKKLNGVDTLTAQKLLDATAWQAQNGGFKTRDGHKSTPLRFLDYLCRELENGTFDDSGALEIQEKRQPPPVKHTKARSAEIPEAFRKLGNKAKKEVNH